MVYSKLLRIRDPANIRLDEDSEKDEAEESDSEDSEDEPDEASDLNTIIEINIDDFSVLLTIILDLTRVVLETIYGLTLFYFLVGKYFIFPTIIIMVILVLNYYLSKRIYLIADNLAILRDKRMRVTTLIFTCIKQVKLYAIE